MSKLDWVSFKYFATGTLRDSTVVGDGADNGKGCAEIATAVVDTAVVKKFQFKIYYIQIDETFCGSFDGHFWNPGLRSNVTLTQKRKIIFL